MEQLEHIINMRAHSRHIYMPITNVVFFYFHLPTINTTLVINNLTHLTIHINVITLFFSLCFAYGWLDTLVCAMPNSAFINQTVKYSPL